jgi:hypothetical protein
MDTEILKELLEKVEALKAQTPQEDMNIFDARFGRLENTHSDIIAKFIDEDRAFAKTFFETINLKPERVPAMGKLHVHRERGHIDVLIEDGERAVVIENKLDARDQPQQLQRYHEWAQEQGYKEITLLYLTYYGRQPSADSMGDLPVKCISYERHIIPWLENSCSHASPTQQTMIKVYTEYLRELINRNKYMVAIAETVFSDTKYVSTLVDLCRAMNGKNLLEVPEIKHRVKEILQRAVREYTGNQSLGWKDEDEGILDEEADIVFIMEPDIIYGTQDGKKELCNILRIDMNSILCDKTVQSIFKGDLKGVVEWVENNYKQLKK